MIMGEGEICISYRSAAHKAKQISILAQLNGTTEDEIKKILIQNGAMMPVRKKPKDEEQKENGITEKAEETPAEPAPEHMHIPEYVEKAVFERLDVLEAEIKEREREYKELAEFMKSCG